MRILLDQGVPAPLRKFLTPHTVNTAFELDWNTLKNGDLLAVAERDGFDALVTTDQNLKYQQNLKARKIAVVVLSTTSWKRIEKVAPGVAQTIIATQRGSFTEIPVP